MSQFFQELKRRKVLKTLGVYGAAAIVITQLVASIFPYLYLPKEAVTFVIVLAILGFPITFFYPGLMILNAKIKQMINPKMKMLKRKKNGALPKKFSSP